MYTHLGTAVRTCFSQEEDAVFVSDRSQRGWPWIFYKPQHCYILFPFRCSDAGGYRVKLLADVPEHEKMGIGGGGTSGAL